MTLSQVCAFTMDLLPSNIPQTPYKDKKGTNPIQ